jgi:alkylation response protein AidB-like acyl-CoA dehydrogenase
MHPEPTSEQQTLMAGVRDVLKREISPEKLLDWARRPGGAEAALLARVAELGWLGMAAPEAAGGIAASFIDVSLLFEECARGLLPLQVVNYMRGVQAVVDADPRCALLAPLVRGERTLALALDEEFDRDPARYATRVENGTVTGRKCYVPNGEGADYHLVAAREGRGLSLVVVATGARAGARTGGLAVESHRGMADDSQAHVRYERVPVEMRLGTAGEGREALARLWLRQRLLALAEMVGGMEWVLDATVGYVKERWQFGQPIALFQAVRHQAADMATTVTCARHLARQAICRTIAGTLEGTELESALAYVGQAFKRVCWTGHHLHGGLGFVVEHPLHWQSERAQSYCIRYTPEAPELRRIAAKLLD